MSLQFERKYFATYDIKKAFGNLHCVWRGSRLLLVLSMILNWSSATIVIVGVNFRGTVYELPRTTSKCKQHR